MGESTARFGIDIDADASSAVEAATALAKLRSTLEMDTAALRAMEGAMKAVQSEAVVDVQVFRTLKATLDMKKSSVLEARNQYILLGRTFSKLKSPAGVKEAAGALAKVKPAADQATGGLMNMINAAKVGLGPMGGLSGRISMLAGAIGKGGMAALMIAGAAALAMVVVGAIAGAVALSAFAFASADAARSQGLLLQGLTGSALGASELQSVIDSVASGVALSGEKVGAYARELYTAGLRGGELEAALTAAAMSSAVLGETAGGEFMTAAKAAATAGESVAVLAGNVKTKLGGVAAAQLLGFSAQAMKLKANIGKLFAGINIEPLLNGLKEMLSVFDVSTATGRALRTMLEIIFTPLGDAVATLGPIVKGFFQGLIVSGLLVMIGFLRVRNALRDTFGGDSKSEIDGVTTALYAGVAAATILGATLLYLAVSAGIAFISMLGGLAIAGWAAVAPFVALAFSVSWPFLLAAVAVAGLVAAIVYLPDLFKKAYAFMAAIEWSQLGKYIVDGIVNGISAGAQWLMDAVTGLGMKAKKALMSSLGMGSPSKVFAELGTFTAQGFAQGVDEGGPVVDSAVSNMVSIPNGEISTPGGATTNNSKSTGPITIYLTAPGGDAKSIVDELKQSLLQILEGAAISVGTPLNPETA